MRVDRSIAISDTGIVLIFDRHNSALRAGVNASHVRASRIIGNTSNAESMAPAISARGKAKRGFAPVVISVIVNAVSIALIAKYGFRSAN